MCVCVCVCVCVCIKCSLKCKLPERPIASWLDWSGETNGDKS